jgi:hypothetical protein
MRALKSSSLRFMRAAADGAAKVTLPSPSLFVNFWSPERSQ